MSRIKLKKLPYFLVVPLSLDQGWKDLKYSSIPKNRVKQKESALEIVVEKSAGPLAYPIKSSRSFGKLVVKGEVKGGLNLSSPQGEKETDDFAVRVGVVYRGEKTLNWAQKLIAPSWVKELHGLASEDRGISQIYFYNLAQKGKRPDWNSRVHPLSDLLHEKIVGTLPRQGKSFRMEVNLKERQVLGIWLSSDGDQTDSSYRVRFDRIELKSDSQKSAP